MAHVYGPTPSSTVLPLTIRGLAAQAAGDLPAAAMWLRMALDATSEGDDDSLQQMLAGVALGLPAEAAAALDHGGASGLRVYIEERCLPPCLRQPKEAFPHYKQWMRARLQQVLGPEATPAVVDGLLGMDAVDLDLLLQAAEAHGDDRVLQQRVDALHDAPATPVLELSWEEASALRGRTTGLLTDT